MFKLVHYGNALPHSIVCDPSAEFQPGMVAELTVVSNMVMGTVSNGTAPLGIIDDIKTKSFTNISWNEEVIVPATGVINGNGELVTPIDVKMELRKANILASSFTSTIDILLNAVNGVVTFPAGTKLNIDLTGSGTYNGIRTIVSYTYYVPNIPGDDSTLGSGRMTIWYERMFFESDQFETNQQYPLRANLYVSEVGLLTTRKPSDRHPSVAMVTAPPSAYNSLLQALWW